MSLATKSATSEWSCAECSPGHRTARSTTSVVLCAVREALLSADTREACVRSAGYRLITTPSPRGRCSNHPTSTRTRAPVKTATNTHCRLVHCSRMLGTTPSATAVETAIRTVPPPSRESSSRLSCLCHLTRASALQLKSPSLYPRRRCGERVFRLAGRLVLQPLVEARIGPGPGRVLDTRQAARTAPLTCIKYAAAMRMGAAANDHLLLVQEGLSVVGLTVVNEQP
jgi:hypothetical protein